MHHRIWNAFAHASVILACMFLVFFCIDQINPAMDFLGSALSKWLLLVFILCSLCNSLSAAVFLFRKARHGREHRPARNEIRPR